MSHTEAPTRVVSLKLPRSLDRRLTEMARRRHTTRSAILREALDAYTRPRGKTFGELTRDICGSVEGPGDLSTNSKYMEGYGR